MTNQLVKQVNKMLKLEMFVRSWLDKYIKQFFAIGWFVKACWLVKTIR